MIYQCLKSFLLSIYPDSKKTVSLTINIVENMPFSESIYNNPRDFFELKDSIIFGVSNSYVRWYKNDNSKIDFMQKKIKRSFLIDFLYRFKDIQFDNFPNKIGMIFHELVLIPYLYQLPDYSLIHGSAFSNDNQLFILGGTGGTGKTSLSMTMCKQSDFDFVTDDILPISSNEAFFNFAYPKIYAYNTVGSKKIEKEILRKHSFISKIQWKIMKKLSGVRVRRRVNPLDFYKSNNLKKQYSKINYIVLARGNFEKISIEKVNDIELISEVSLEIIKTELSNINNNLSFHKFNAGISKLGCVFDFEIIMEQKIKVYRDFFSKSNNYILKIPSELTHDDYIREAENIIRTL
jgi:hypothetical protein